MSDKRQKKGKALGCLISFLIFVTLSLAVVIAIVALMNNSGVRKKVASYLPHEEIPYQEVSYKEEVFAPKYYYNSLSKDEKVTFQEILQGAQKQEEEIYVHADSPERVNELYQLVLNDYPELFWCDGASSTTTYEGYEIYTVLKPKYLYDHTERTRRQAQVETAVQNCLNGVSQQATEYEKILYVYEYIVDNVDYALEAPDNQNIYSVFVNKRSVCAGYSRAVQYLLEKMGIFCTYVTGTTSTGESHAWNLVSCEGQYYHLDVTWGDPIFQSEESGETQQGNISYDYMLCDDEELFRTHYPDPGLVLPECTSMEMNYYVLNGMYYQTYDHDEALTVLNTAVAAGETEVVLKYATSEVYEAAKSDLYNGVIQAAAQNLATWYGLQEVSYSYINSDDLSKIVIRWNYQ